MYEINYKEICIFPETYNVMCLSVSDLFYFQFILIILFKEVNIHCPLVRIAYILSLYRLFKEQLIHMKFVTILCDIVKKKNTYFYACTCCAYSHVISQEVMVIYILMSFLFIYFLGFIWFCDYEHFFFTTVYNVALSHVSLVDKV